MGVFASAIKVGKWLAGHDSSHDMDRMVVFLGRGVTHGYHHEIATATKTAVLQS